MVVFGGTGVVAFASAVISAVEGAEAILVGYDGPERVRKLAEEANARFGVDARLCRRLAPRSRRPSLCATPS